MMMDRDEEESVETDTMVEPMVGGHRVELLAEGLGRTRGPTDRGGTRVLRGTGREADGLG